MQAEETERIFTIRKNYEKSYSLANIRFVFDGSNWHFHDCDYTLKNRSNYDLDDWMFLRNVANEIERIGKELNK